MTIRYENFSLLGGVKPAAQPASDITQNAARAQLLRGVASTVATSAIAAWSSHTMDRIRTRMQESRREHELTMARIGRQQVAWRGAVQMNHMRQAQARESLALQVQEMQTKAKLETELGHRVGPSFDRIQRIVGKEFESARFDQEAAQVAQRAALWGEMASHGFVGTGPSVERGTSGVEQVGSFLVDSIRIGRESFGRG